MWLSVLDQSPIREGSTPAEALRETVALAQAAEGLGYHRYWLAEHHNESLAGTAPEVLAAHVASRTSSIRVGAGGVLLSYHSPLRVAEAFRTLEALFPGRIDLGLARADADEASGDLLSGGGGPVSDDEYPRRVAGVVGLLTGDLPSDHPGLGIDVNPTRVGTPEVWVLGSSAVGSGLAAALGLPFSFAHFVTPTFGPQITASYRSHFRPSPVCGEPRSNLGVSVICAPTTAEAERLAASTDVWHLTSDRTQRGPLPSVEAAQARIFTELDRVQIAERRQRMTVGDPALVRDRLTHLAAIHGVEELVVLTVCHDPQARLRSYQLLAAAFGLQPRRQ